MLTPDGSARRQAWTLIYLLGGALALWASVGIDHTYRISRTGYAHCTAHRAAPGCDRVLAQAAPLRPVSVWIFAATGIALLLCAAAAAVFTLRVRTDRSGTPRRLATAAGGLAFR